MTATEAGNAQHMTVVRQKPLMDMKQILLMNLGFFGIQYSFGMQQTAVNPIYNVPRRRPRTTCRSSTWPGRSPVC